MKKLVINKKELCDWLGAKKKVPKKLDQLIDQAVKDINLHFKKENYKLDADIYKSQIMSDYLGFDITAEILKRLDKKISIDFNNGIYFVKVKKNEKT